MRIKLLAILTAASVALAAFLPTLVGTAQAFGVDGQEAQLIVCTHSGYSQAQTRTCVANALNGDTLSTSGQKCLEAAGITAAGVLAGGVIGGAAARAIAGGVIGGGGAACLGKLV